MEKDPYETENLVFDPDMMLKTEELLKLLRIHMEEMNDEQKAEGDLFKRIPGSV